MCVVRGYKSFSPRRTFFFSIISLFLPKCFYDFKY